MASSEAKDRLRNLEKDGIRVLSIRGRYVRRAEYLQNHPPFRRDIARRRSEWDAAWPEFAIGNSPIPIHELALAPGPYSAVPPKLYSAHCVMCEVETGKQARAKDSDSIEERLIQGFWEWRQVLSSICAEWWPRRYYPLTYYADHLAGRFVAGCLLCSPEYLPADAAQEWISVPTLQAVSLPAPIERMVAPATMAYQQGWESALMTRLNEAAEARLVLTPELLAEMGHDANEAGRAAKNAWRDDQADLDWDPDHRQARIGIHWVVPLYPGMTREDLEEGASQIMDELRSQYGEHMLREDARRLSRERKSARVIAGLMGVSVSQVLTWIKGPD
jgi:hypothetical protein